MYSPTADGTACPTYTLAFDPAVNRLLTCKVAGLVAGRMFRSADRLDLLQELSMHLFQARRHYDPTRSSPATFADRVLTNKAADLARQGRAGSRDPRRLRPMSDGIDVPEAGLTLDRASLVLDVREAVAALPPELRAVAQLLMQFGEAESARRAGCSRQRFRTLRGQIADRLRSLDPRHRRISLLRRAS